MQDQRINSQESLGPLESTPSECVPEQSLRASFSSSMKCYWNFLYVKKDKVELNVTEAKKPEVFVGKRYKTIIVEMFHCNFCKRILEIKCLFIHLLYVFCCWITVFMKMCPFITLSPCPTFPTTVTPLFHIVLSLIHI